VTACVENMEMMLGKFDSHQGYIGSSHVGKLTLKVKEVWEKSWGKLLWLTHCICWPDAMRIE